ncbi:MAG: hypothetical protein RIR33_751 [Pseudomonadota bacterium]|jgi:hypothetical protein
MARLLLFVVLVYPYWVNRGFGGLLMSEVVLLMGPEESRDPSRLMEALDAFAKWASETGLWGEAADAPDIMVKSEFAGGQMRRKLVFQDRDHAARFLVFWRSERHRARPSDPAFAQA